MARLRFFKGALTGKIGEFVGANWKGINYLRTHTAPSNPRTAGQISVRLVFKKISLFAAALFAKGLLGLIPPARQMTERNSVFKANRQMFTDKTFVPEALQVSKANLNADVSNLQANWSATGRTIGCSATVTFADPNEQAGKKIFFLVYDHVKGVAISCGVAFTNSTNVGSWNGSEVLPTSPTFDTTEGSQVADCRIYAFVAGTNANGKKFISQTFSVALA